MIPRTSPRWPPPPPPPYRRQPPTGWRALLIGLAFGFSAGLLFTIGIISLINANGVTQAQPPVGNGAVTSNATPTPTLIPTSGPTASPASEPTAEPTAVPTFEPTPDPTAVPALGTPNDPLLGPDDPRFYAAAIIVFLILAGVLLLKRK